MNKPLICAIACLFLNACSAPAVKDSAIIQQSAIEQAKTVNLSPQQVLDETRDLQILAQREDLYFYSPNYIAQAESEIRQAEEAFKEKLAPQQIITHALTGQQLLKRGLETKQTVLTQLKLALDGLAMLTELKTEKLMASEFSDIQSEIKELIILIEQGNTTQALKEQSDVLTEIALLEIEVLKKTYLSKAEMALEKAEDADAEDHATLSYEQASVSVERLQAFIEANPKKRQDINLKTQDTVHLCQHAQNVAIAAKPLLALSNEAAEQHILFIEKLIARIGHALNHEDVSYLPLDNQSIALAQAAETINKQAQSIKQQGQWETEKAELKASLAKLQAQLNTATQAAIIEEPSTSKAAQKNSTEQSPHETPPAAIDQSTDGEPTLINETPQEVADNQQKEKEKPMEADIIDKSVAAETKIIPEKAKEESQKSEVVVEDVSPAVEATKTDVAEIEVESTETEPVEIEKQSSEEVVSASNNSNTPETAPQDEVETP